jgi:hypothetical protein
MMDPASRLHIAPETAIVGERIGIEFVDGTRRVGTFVAHTDGLLTLTPHDSDQEDENYSTAGIAFIIGIDRASTLPGDTV